ncbi:hypothetical protein GKE82_26120 [Conexibacter sp. W3-3-2]|uniref:hypothetical protein n=1 Tax=Conexibacter sp. W3-3-2 TaxID=2675227 RepID=UPI0012B8C091|nr:hypothetical protein [Conexibacter sp. W3-3-2]MTD47682.1 hypothetical protein [Conexibacter sp. W3-3-2]
MTTLLVLAAVGVVLYLVGEKLLRVGGVVIMAIALVNGVMLGNGSGLMTFATFCWGMVAWLVGHALFRIRYGVWASTIAATVLTPLVRSIIDRASAARMSIPPAALADDAAVAIAEPTMPAAEDVGVRAFALTEGDELDVAAEDALLFGEADWWEDDCGSIDEVDEVAHLFPYSDRPLGRVVPRSRRRGSH